METTVLREKTLCPASHPVLVISFAMGLEYVTCWYCVGLSGWSRGAHVLKREEVYPLLGEIFRRTDGRLRKVTL